MAFTISQGRNNAIIRKPMRSAAEVTEQFGLEVPRQLQWHKWQAAAEHVKVLSVKNVSTQVLRVSYKLLHSSSAFSVDFPESWKLSPGMVASIKVYFRPLRRQSYTDQFELSCDSNSILVPLEAVLPASKLQLQAALDFGCVPAREPVMQRLPIRNIGDAMLQFSWKIQEPFAIEPAGGQLAPGQTLHCEVHFNPQEAAAYRVSAACSLDNGEVLTVQIDGMAKFPFLSIEQSCIDFGDLVAGQTSESVVRFGNHSAVPANFTVAASGGSADGAFRIHPMQGTLQPDSFSVLQVQYSSRSAGTFSCQNFTLSTPGGNKVTLVCQGTSTGPQLRLSSRVFNFGNVKAGQTPSKVLYLENMSDVPLAFECLGEANGIFELTRARGVVPPRSMMHTAVGFKGVLSANYWQRLLCLVKDSEPVAIDVLATCYDDHSRPPPLAYKHVTAYLDRIAAGKQPVPESSLENGTSGSTLGNRSVGSPALSSLAAAAGGPDVGNQRQVASGDSGIGYNSSHACSPQALLQPQQQPQQLVGPDSWNLLFGGLGAASAVTVSDTQLDFGSCSRLKTCEAKSFTVTNNTAARLLVSVVVPAWQDPLAPLEKPTTVFQAFPDSLELRPNSSATVRLAFRPPKDGVHYCQGLMLLARLKAMRSYRLVQDGQDVAPPWCIDVLASGNTFANMNPEFSPKVTLSTTNISFPACRLGDAVHQTLALQNLGDTPVHFRFTAPHAASDEASDRGAAAHIAGCEWFGPVGVVPCQGVLEPKAQRLIALRFKPASLVPCHLKLTCIFNNTSANNTTVLLSGSASEPRLTWDITDGKLFFRPTCVGATSQRVITVTNTSRVPVGWQWILSRKLQDVVVMEPMRGVLRGFESTKVAVNFAPVAQQVYNARAALLLLPPDEVKANASTAAAAALSTVVEAPADASNISNMTTAGLQESGQPNDAGLTAAELSLPVQQQEEADSRDSEKLILTVVGEATQGALRVEPSNVSFGVVNVGYPQHRTLTLINQSSGVLRYSVELVVDSTETIERDTAACEFAAPTAALLAGARGDDAGGGRGCLEDCWVDEADGVVNARSSKVLTLTLLPKKRGQYKLKLNLRASQVPLMPKVQGMRSCSTGSGGSSIAATAAQGLIGVAPSSPVGLASSAARVCGLSSSSGLGSSSGDGYASDADCSRGAPVVSAGDCFAAGLRAKAPLAVVDVSATAAFPALMITDVFCLGLPKQVSWQMLGIQQLNKELCSAVSAAELQAQALSDKGSLTNDNAAALLPPFEVDMGVVAAGQVPRSFWMQFSNTGALPLSWELHSYDAPQVELENWVEPARPLTDAEKERAFIIDNKIFNLHPHSGSLQPGESQQVCFTFDPVTEGKYQLPLFLRVKDGKQLQLQLKGQAVPASAQLPLAVRGSQTCVLAAAPLGELEPPLQCYTLRNGGPAPLQYSLDTTPLQQLTRQNYGAEVIKYAGGSPLKGEIPVGDVAIFNWLFQPLEAKCYSVALPLSLGPAAPQPLLLRGRGYHPVQQPDEAEPTEEEVSQHWQDWLGFTAAAVVAPPCRVLHINQEMLDLGVCLPASTTRRLLVLQNAAEVPLVFLWDLAVFEEERAVISGRLSISPASGVLEPGESRVCQVSFQSGLAPQLFSGEVFCYARPEQTAEEAAREEQLLMDDTCLSSCMPSLANTATPSTAAVVAEGYAGEQVEEVIAEHPAWPARRASALRTKIKNRLPLHLSMTASARSKSRQLDKQYTAALTLQQQSMTQQQQQQQHAVAVLGTSSLRGSAGLAATSGATATVEWGLSAAAAAIEPQMLIVTVQGSVLGKEHVRAGRYMPAAQQQSALKLLEVPHLLPLVERPVSLLLPPGSMGTSAAAAKAAVDGAARDSAAVRLPAAPPAVVAAAGVLQSVLAEVWADADVTAAFERLQPAPVELVTQVISGEVVRESSAQPQQQRTAEAAGDADHGSSAEVGAGAEQCKPPPAEEVMSDPEFRAFADYVLDNAIIGILQDSVQQGLLEQAMQKMD